MWTVQSRVLDEWVLTFIAARIRQNVGMCFPLSPLVAFSVT